MSIDIKSVLFPDDFFLHYTSSSLSNMFGMPFFIGNFRPVSGQMRSPSFISTYNNNNNAVIACMLYVICIIISSSGNKIEESTALSCSAGGECYG